jgi:hypothetical protein
MIKHNREFLHSHDHLIPNITHEHVVVDRTDWEEARRIFAGQYKSYEFIVCLDDGIDIESISEPLLKAGCDDGTLASCGNRVWIRFTRKAESLEQAIRSAVNDIRSAKCCTVVRIEVEPH